MGNAIPNVRHADNAGNTYGTNWQTGEIDGTIFIQC